VEGRGTINEAIRERLIELLQEFLGKLDSVKPELEQPIAYELDHIRREVKTIIERYRTYRSHRKRTRRSAVRIGPS
jgi:NADH:ubiquinone oxidoreductase subunit E